MFKTDDPLHDFLRHEDELYKLLRQKPKCCMCGNYIQDEYGYHMGIDWYCENCINDFREYIEE